MKVLVAAHRMDETDIFNKVNQKFGFEITYKAEKLTEENCQMVEGYEALAINAGCIIDEKMAEYLAGKGVKYILTRTAGFDHMDMKALKRVGIRCANVPAYSPNAISEHTVLLVLSALRKLKEQLRLIEEKYFFITGLRGRELRSMTVGVIGAGRIGATTIKNLSGFGCKILACDAFEKDSVKEYADYVSMEEILEKSDILVLHCPMTAENQHLISAEKISKMKDGVILVNTARGGLVDTEAVLQALKSGKIAFFAMDVYEHEEMTQRKDFRGKELPDKLLEELLSMDNCIFTSHTAFYTDEAIENIADITLTNLYEMSSGQCGNEL